MKILIIKPSSLGDVVQALPVLRLLKQHDPEHEIYWWIEASLAPLLEGDPDLAGVIPFDRQRLNSATMWWETWRHLQWIRNHRFDWVIDLQSLARTGLVAWLANGRLTMGLDDHREGARGFYDIVVPRASPRTHAVDWYRSVLSRLRVPLHWKFSWLPERPAIARALCEKWSVEGRRWISLQPGARWPNKRWPAEHFATLLAQLSQARPDLHFAVLGSAADRDLGRQISQASPERCLDLTGALSLPELVEWIRLSEMMVTNDTGPMHVAAALGRPIVALFGPTHPERTGPYGQIDHVIQLDLPCVPCLKDQCHYEKPLECLRGISPARVFAEIQRRLALPSHGEESLSYAGQSMSRAALAGL